MAYENFKKSAVIDKTCNTGHLDFDEIADEAFDRVWEKQVQYSIGRINEMNKELALMEKELTELAGLGP